MKTLFLSLALFISGCAAVAPGNDPLVVNCERTETIAASTFDLVMKVDDSNRAFFAVSVPKFHTFVQWLREPQQVDSYTLPRCLALVMNADNVKLAYKSGRATSNDLVTVVATLNSAMEQAAGWLNVVTNRP
jgi:hypothetical protein